MSSRGRQSLILLDDVTVNGAGPVRTLPSFNDVEYGIFQVDISGGTAVVTIEGRVSDDLPWIVIETFTVSGATRITPFPQMRSVVSGIAGATCRAEASF